MLSACYAGTSSPGELALQKPNQQRPTEAALSPREQASVQGELDEKINVVFLPEATPNQVAVAEQQLREEGEACQASRGRWHPLWLSCTCPPAHVFVAGQGCTPTPTLVLAHAGCEGPRSQASTACFRHIRLGPLMLDLNFQQARRLLPLLRHGSEADAASALLEDARTTLPDEKTSGVRLHQTHRLKENIAAFALATEPWLRVDPPHYVFVAPVGPPGPTSREGRVSSLQEALATILRLTPATAADLCRVVHQTQTLLSRATENRPVPYAPSFRVHPVHGVLQRALRLPEAETQNAGKIRVTLVVTLRDVVPLARTLRFDFGDSSRPESSGTLELYLSPQGAPRASAFRFATAGPTTAWHLFDARNKAVTKMPLRTLVNPKRSLLRSCIPPKGKKTMLGG